MMVAIVASKPRDRGFSSNCCSFFIILSLTPNKFYIGRLSKKDLGPIFAKMPKSNPRRLGGMHKHYLYDMPSPHSGLFYNEDFPVRNHYMNLPNYLN